MNWKNITLEPGFVKQELNFNGDKAVNYIPLDQVDSFGVVSSENKRWLYIGIFAAACALLMAFGGEFQAMTFTAMIAAGFICYYFFTRKTWFTITSSQTKFLVEIMTTQDELQKVNAFIDQMKQGIHKWEVVQKAA